MKLIPFKRKKTSPDIRQIDLGSYHHTYDDEDVKFLKSLISRQPVISHDRIIDGFSIETLLDCIPFCKQFNLQRLHWPFPDDGYRSESIEYISLAHALKNSKGSTFSAVELGAGWGPWISLAGVLAKRLNKEKIHLIGVEADASRFNLMQKHMITNNLMSDDLSCDDHNDNNVSIKCQLIKGAAAAKNSKLYFPKLPVTDMGSSTSETNQSKDYRGFSCENAEVVCEHGCFSKAHRQLGRH